MPWFGSTLHDGEEPVGVRSSASCAFPPSSRPVMTLRDAVLVHLRDEQLDRVADRRLVVRHVLEHVLRRELTTSWLSASCVCLRMKS